MKVFGCILIVMTLLVQGCATGHIKHTVKRADTGEEIVLRKIGVELFPRFEAQPRVTTRTDLPTVVYTGRSSDYRSRRSYYRNEPAVGVYSPQLLWLLGGGRRSH